MALEADDLPIWCLDRIEFVPLAIDGGPKVADGRGGCAVRWGHRHCPACSCPMQPDDTLCLLCRREEARLSTPARDVRAVDALRNHNGGPLYRQSSSTVFTGTPKHQGRLKDYDEPVKPPSRFAGKDRHRPLEEKPPLD